MANQQWRPLGDMFPQGYQHPGYLTQTSISNLRSEHNKVVLQLETEMEMLRAQVKELHQRIQQMEMDNSPIMLI